MPDFLHREIRKIVKKHIEESDSEYAVLRIAIIAECKEKQMYQISPEEIGRIVDQEAIGYALRRK